MKVVFLVGPTSTGKSDFANLAAARLGGEIVNADSLQFYKSLNIGTAKPTLEERSQVPHHLYDIVDVGEVLTAGDYRRLALATLAELERKKRDVVFVVGGSGFYIQALEKGMFDFGKVEHSIHEKVKREAEEGLSALFQELLQQDPAYAKKIGPTDSYRITRAVELMRMFGKTPTQLRDEFVPVPFPYPVVKLGFMMDRDTLFHKVSLRTKKMLQLGLVQEVKSVLEQTSEDWPPLSSIGYKEVLRFLRGELPAESLETEIVQNTMRLAKRQKTWFRRDTEIHWFDPSQGFDGPLHELQVKLRL